MSEFSTHFSENSTTEGELDFEDEPLDMKIDVHSIKTDECSLEESKKVVDLEEGEVEDNIVTLIPQEDDLEEGEVKDTSPSTKQQIRQVCRYFNIGKCTWGNVCRFLHLSTNDRGNYNMFSSNSETTHQSFPETISSSDSGHFLQRGGYLNSEYNSSNPTQHQETPNDLTSPIESAWERGLRHAREVMVKANQRREQEPDFEEKRLNLSLEENSRITSFTYEKDTDVYGKALFEKESDEVFFRYEDLPNVGDSGSCDFKNKWQRQKFENFEIRWTKPGGHKSEFKEDLRNVKAVDHERQPRHLPANCWQDERLYELQSARTRADEWRDPWRRSKSPKGRRSTSRKRSHRSYSSVSSRSFSGRSCRSSFSSSQSSSRSSYYSSRRSSSQTPSKSHSRSYSRSLSMDSVSSVSSSVSHASNLPTSSQFYSDQDHTLVKSEILGTTSNIDSSTISKRNEKELVESVTQDYIKISSKPKDDVSASVQHHSSSTISTKNNISYTETEIIPMKKESSDSIPQTAPKSRSKSVNSNSEFIEFKSRSKNSVNVSKKVHEFNETKILHKESTVKVPSKRSSSPVNKTVNIKKSKNSRREELLQQLKAVEDAIARKRAKLFDFPEF